MFELRTEKLKTIIIFLLSLVIVYMAARQWERRHIDGLIRQNQQLITLKVRTEQLFSRSSEEVIQAMRDIGYYFSTPVPAKVEEEK